MLDQLYLDARYPGDQGLLPNGKPTVREASTFYKIAKEVFEASKSCLLIYLTETPESLIPQKSLLTPEE